MSANNNLLSPLLCAKEHYCASDGVLQRVYCNAAIPQYQSLSLAAELLACSTINDERQLLSLAKPKLPKSSLITMETYDKHTEKTLIQIWHIQCTIMVTLIAFALARLVVSKSSSPYTPSSVLATAGSGNLNKKPKVFLRYLLEFFIISVPMILSVNIGNSYVELVVFGAFAVLILIMLRTNCWIKADAREFEFGRRPTIFTLIRSTINILTALCILAIDFKSFPKTFRKSRRYGAGLMDVGIGLFVFSMGLVSSRPRRLSDLRKCIFTVGCMLVLGLARTVVITAIDYSQDEHEYGVHLNAFFTLGFTKLFATLIGFMARSDKQLLPLGLAILIKHEVILQMGVWKFVMNPDLERTDFLTANREGLCSLPGYIALYILAQFIGQWLQEKDLLEFDEIKQKFKALFLSSLSLWLIVVLSVFVVGIARVTCNFGYVVWILAISVTMFTLYLFVFDIVLDTIKPVYNERYTKISSTEMGDGARGSGGGGAVSKVLDNVNTKLPLVIEAVNYNGLTYFLLANILTGATNIFLKTDEKSSLQSVVILFCYMLITTTVAFALYRFRIRIA